MDPVWSNLDKHKAFGHANRMHTISLPVSGLLRFHTQTKTGANMARSPCTLHQREYGRAEWLDRKNDCSLAVAIPTAPSRQLCHLFGCAAPFAYVFGGMTEWKQYSSNSSSLLLCISLSCLCLLQTKSRNEHHKAHRNEYDNNSCEKDDGMNGIMFSSNNMMGYGSLRSIYLLTHLQANFSISLYSPV